MAYRSTSRVFHNLLCGAVLLFAAGYAVAGEQARPAATITPAVFTPASSAIDVRVRVADGAGEVRLGLYDSAHGFAEAQEMAVRTVAVEGGYARVQLSELPPGRYAFRLFHDANANGELDTGAFGIPTERYYFSNGARDLLSAPEWEEASFRLPAGAYAFEVDLD